MPNHLANIVLVCPRHKLRLVSSATDACEMLSCPSRGCPVACCVGSALVDTNRRVTNVCSDCDWEDFVDEIDEMLDSGDFEWARDTCEGIRTTVSDREHVTERQREAIRNIAEKRR